MLARWFFWFLFVLIAVQPLRVKAHDHDPANDAWFKSLTNQVNGACCDGSDAFSVEAVDWERTGDPEFPFSVKWDGQKLRVFKSNVVKGANKIGISKIWPYRATDEDGTPTGPWLIRCFMPGAEG